MGRERNRKSNLPELEGKNKKEKRTKQTKNAQKTAGPKLSMHQELKIVINNERGINTIAKN